MQTALLSRNAERMRNENRRVLFLLTLLGLLLLFALVAFEWFAKIAAVILGFAFVSTILFAMSAASTPYENPKNKWKRYSDS